VDLATPVMVPVDFAAADIRGVLAKASNEAGTTAINPRIATSRPGRINYSPSYGCST